MNYPISVRSSQQDSLPPWISKIFLSQTESLHFVKEASWINTGHLCGLVDASVCFLQRHVQIILLHLIHNISLNLRQSFINPCVGFVNILTATRYVIRYCAWKWWRAIPIFGESTSSFSHWDCPIYSKHAWSIVALSDSYDFWQVIWSRPCNNSAQARP